MIYLIQNLQTLDIKIGISKNPEKRVRQLQTGSSEKLLLLKIFDITNDRQIEKRLHKMLWQNRQRGEWFALTNLHIDFVESYIRENGQFNG